MLQNARGGLYVTGDIWFRGPCLSFALASQQRVETRTVSMCVAMFHSSSLQTLGLDLRCIVKLGVCFWPKRVCWACATNKMM